ASLGVPKTLDKDTDAIDPLHNQAQADYLFLKSEMESGAGRGTESIELLKTALIYDSESPTLMQKLAIEYYKLGNVATALYWAEKAFELAPDRRDLALLAAGLHTSNKSFGKAEEIYKKLVKHDADDMEALLYLGAVYTELKNFPKAIETFKTVSQNKEYNSKHLAHYYLARVYSEQNSKNAKHIKEELVKAITIKPDFFEASSMLGQFIQKESGVDAAIKFYEKLQKEHGPQVKLAEVLSQYYITKNQYDLAYQQLEIVDEAGDDNMQVKLKMALILIDKKMYDKAIPKLEEILTAAPDSDKVRFYLSAVYEEKRDYKSAVAQYLKIEKDSSYFEEARLHAAFIFKVMGNLDQSIAALKDLMPSKAENPQTYIFMSQLYEEKNDLNNSLALLKAASEKFTDAVQVIYYLGMLQDKMNLKADMMASMKKVIELEPDHSQALNYLAYSWAESGEQLEKAETYARRAVSKAKDDAFILDTLGWVLFKKGDYKNAAEVLEKAVKMQPEVGIIAEHLGDVYSKLNLNEKAHAQMEKARDLEADATHKKEISVKLTQIEVSLKTPRTPSSVSADSSTKESP
ncbi:MAG: tetratricopeptide repeat protein, partial [Pseudobdellovibrio sp.]